MKLCQACENWNRMQNAANLGVKNTYKCSMKFDSIRISLIRERYWFEIRDVLVPTFHAV